MNVKRFLSIDHIGTSAFIFGCRQVGKTWLLRHCLEPDIYIDLLKKTELVRYTANPGLIYAEIEALNKNQPLIVIDEIQKVPGLLDEIHRAIESPCNSCFILTGSSARKLKRNHANMLGGRAVTLKLFPFCYGEIRNSFTLTDFLQFGGLPRVFMAESRQLRKQLLESYVETYLKEEIYEEALIRNLPAFTRFLEFAGHENGNTINYSAISMQLGISSHTVKEYFSILEDTLLGFFLMPYHKSHRKRLTKHPKFYFIDPGLVFALKKMLSVELIEGTALFGDAFEHFIILEATKAISYTGEEITTSFFRTTDGAEVDLILEKHGQIIPVEIKSSTAPKIPSGLRSFLRDHEVHTAYCVCRTPRAYKLNNITFIPWQTWIEKIYDATLFSA